MKYTTYYTAHYSDYAREGLERRYLSPDHLREHLSFLAEKCDVREEIGRSVQGRAIEMYRIGHGPVCVLMWSQMHGNESTTTRGLFDLLNFLYSERQFSELISQELSLFIIPQLNPDGAHAYTRVNANQIDLNRDAQDLSQPESLALRKAFEKAAPHFCFNLHDQRTIFSAGDVAEPATVSFLSPAFNAQRDLSEAREEGMRLIAVMNQVLQNLIPGKIGRYDDGFNLNCVGDTFQSLNIPTVLFEAGHIALDYKRMETRKYIAIALCAALETLASGTLSAYDFQDYFKIPENKKYFCDFLLKNVRLHQMGSPEKVVNLAFLYREVLDEGEIRFVPELIKEGETQALYGHQEFDLSHYPVLECTSEDDLRKKALQLLQRVS